LGGAGAVKTRRADLLLSAHQILASGQGGTLAPDLPLHRRREALSKEQECPVLIFVIVSVLVIIGASVLVGLRMSRQRPQNISRHEQMTALKVSGALKHRKSNRE